MRQSLEEIVKTLQALHLQDDQLDLDQQLPPEGVLMHQKWFSRQIRSSANGTAVDQWGWDSREI